MPSPDDSEPDYTTTLSESELYRIVHEATQDAILGAIGTVLWVGIGVVLFLVGLQLVWGSLSLGLAVVGAGLAVVGLAIAAQGLDLVAPIRELF
jgi:hypothetical protein